MRAVIFDLDGTLIDSLGDIAGALNHVLSEAGLETHSLDAVKAMIGEGASELVRHAIAGRADAPHAELLAAYRARYGAHLVVETRPYDGIEELLTLLEERGVPKAVVTNKPHGPAVQIVERLLGQFRWAAIEGQRDGRPMKPDPTMALAAAARALVAPEDCIFVGDTGIDMSTADAAGMISVGCVWGLRDRDELVASGARHVIAHPRELLAILDQSDAAAPQRTGRSPG